MENRVRKIHEMNAMLVEFIIKTIVDKTRDTRRPITGVSKYMILAYATVCTDVSRAVISEHITFTEAKELLSNYILAQINRMYEYIPSIEKFPFIKHSDPCRIEELNGIIEEFDKYVKYVNFSKYEYRGNVIDCITNEYGDYEGNASEIYECRTGAEDFNTDYEDEVEEDAEDENVSAAIIKIKRDSDEGRAIESLLEKLNGKKLETGDCGCFELDVDNKVEPRNDQEPETKEDDSAFRKFLEFFEEYMRKDVKKEK